MLRSITIRCDQPNAALYTFIGPLTFVAPTPDEIAEGTSRRVSTMSTQQLPPQGEQVASLNPNAVALRGAVVKNTRWVIGVVVYCGPDRKVQMNTSGKIPQKVTSMDQQLNVIVALVFAFLFVLCTLCSAMNMVIVSQLFLQCSNPSQPGGCRIPWYFFDHVGEYSSNTLG